MILPQVHLRKPCYDFYFLQIIKFDQLWQKQSQYRNIAMFTSRDLTK